LYIYKLNKYKLCIKNLLPFEVINYASHNHNDRSLN